MDSLAVNFTLGYSASAARNDSQAGVNAVSFSQSWKDESGWAFGTGAGFANQFMVIRVTIAASGTASIDLRNFTNVTKETAQTFSKVKKYAVELLPNDDGTTPATSVSVGNSGTNDFAGFLSAATATFKVFVGGGAAFWVGGPGTAGLPPAYTIANNAITADATHKVIFLTNNDGSNKATVKVTVTGES